MKQKQTALHLHPWDHLLTRLEDLHLLGHKNIRQSRDRDFWERKFLNVALERKKKLSV